MLKGPKGFQIRKYLCWVVFEAILKMLKRITHFLPPWSMLAPLYYCGCPGYNCQPLVAQLNLVVKYFPEVSETLYTVAPFTLTLARAELIVYSFCLCDNTDSVSCQMQCVEEADSKRGCSSPHSEGRPAVLN